MATAGNDSGSYGAPSSPSQLEATHTEGGCSDRPKGGLPTARECFDQRSPIEGPVC
jgi:hypothetical protein